MAPRVPRQGGPLSGEALAVQESVRSYLEGEAQQVSRFGDLGATVSGKTLAKPGSVVLVDPTGGGFTVVLPRITREVLGQFVTVKEVGGSFKPIKVVAADANATIDGASSVTLSGAYDSMVFGAMLPVRPATDGFWGVVYEKISPVFGGLSVKGNAGATTITVQSTYYQFGVSGPGAFDREPPCHGETCSLTEQHVEILVAGTYSISVDGCAELSNGDEMHLQAIINNGATAVPDCHTRVTGRGAGAYSGITAHADYVLAVGDTVELWIENDTGVDDITLVDATLSVDLVTR